MDAYPVTVKVFEAFVVGRSFRRHESLRQSRFFHQLELKACRSDDIDGEAAGFGLRDRALQNSIAGAAIKRRLDVRILFLEGVDESDDLFIVERAVEDDFAFGLGGVLEGGARAVATGKTTRTNRTNSCITIVSSHVSDEQVVHRQGGFHQTLLDLIAVHGR